MEKGKFLQEYRASKAMWVLYWFIIVVFLLLSAAGIAIIVYFPQSDFAGAFIFICCIVVAYLFYRNAKKKMDIPVYALYEHGVERRHKSQYSFIPIERIYDLFLFTTGKSLAPNNLAFKCEESNTWELIGVYHQGDLWKLIISNAEKRVQLLKNEIENGETVYFNYITPATALKNSLTAFSYKKFLASKTSTLGLNLNELLVDGISFPLSSLDNLEANHRNGKFRIIAKSGQDIFSFRETTLWSHMVFSTLFLGLLKSKN